MCISAGLILWSFGTSKHEIKSCTYLGILMAPLFKKYYFIGWLKGSLIMVHFLFIASAKNKVAVFLFVQKYNKDEIFSHLRKPLHQDKREWNSIIAYAWNLILMCIAVNLLREFKDRNLTLFCSQVDTTHCIHYTPSRKTITIK